MFVSGLAPYAMPQAQKEFRLLSLLAKLTRYHVDHCEPYGHLVRSQYPGPYAQLADIPFIPTPIFKRRLLSSLADTRTTTVESSSTTGTPSRVLIDPVTAGLQRQSVHAIYSDFIRSHKRPYVIFDAPMTARGKNILATRGAALMSLMGHASRFWFVLDEHGNINTTELHKALTHINEIGGKFVAFGFTYPLYLAHRELQSRQWRASGLDGYIIHSGGWKRMTDAQVSKDELNALVAERWGLTTDRVIDSYGLTEQLGTIYPDCAAGNKHAPYWADVLIRNPHTLAVKDSGIGMIQLVSMVSHSMPNHSVLTDDLGEVVGVDNCPCGRLGKAWQFRGRAAGGEIRGCGDVRGVRN